VDIQAAGIEVRSPWCTFIQPFCFTLCAEHPQASCWLRTRHHAS
jgi:hypothetical protein